MSSRRRCKYHLCFLSLPLLHDDFKISWESLRKFRVENMLTCISDLAAASVASRFESINRTEDATAADIIHRDINLVIMDYLVSEGYPRAAEKFAKEANIQLPLEEESIQSRVEIRRAIHAGDIDAAITKINDLNPQVCMLCALLPLPPCRIKLSFMHHAESL
jgi:hypothetical protein